MKIVPGSRVTIVYDLFVEGIDESVEEVTEIEPFEFVVGEGEVLDALESALIGKENNESFEINIPSDQAYGPELEEAIVELDKSIFVTEEGFDEEMLEEGEVVPLKDDQGNEFLGLIIENKLNTVVVDCNHPLAGEDLRFVGKIIRIG